MSFKSKILSLVNSFYSLEKQAKRVGVNMGKDNLVASKFWSSEPYLITIGSHCQITSGVKIFTHGGGAAVRNRYPNFDCFGKVSIGNYVYIGTNSLIMPGVNISNNVLVAAGSVVCNSVPAGVVVGGNPARLIGKIEDYIERNLDYNLNTKGLSIKKKEKVLKSLDENKFIKKKYLCFSDN